jgi:hypothetical protein
MRSKVGEQEHSKVLAHRVTCEPGRKPRVHSTRSVYMRLPRHSRGCSKFFAVVFDYLYDRSQRTVEYGGVLQRLFKFLTAPPTFQCAAFERVKRTSATRLLHIYALHQHYKNNRSLYKRSLLDGRIAQWGVTYSITKDRRATTSKDIHNPPPLSTSPTLLRHHDDATLRP